ncbi:hypothetical protein KI387_040280, partial [Taxus chinensis]
TATLCRPTVSGLPPWLGSGFRTAALQGGGSETAALQQSGGSIQNLHLPCFFSLFLFLLLGADGTDEV